MRIDYPRSGRTGLLRFWPSWRQWLSLVVLAAALGVAAFAVLYAVIDIPEPNEDAVAQTTVVYWSDGETELGRLGTANRTSVPLSSLPQHVKDAVLAAEDRSFYEHGGISVTGIGRAVWNNLRNESTQGGSTITQQLVKNYYLTQDRTWRRKVEEFIVSIKMEQQLAKEQILEDYLNTIYFGRGAYGIQAAARAYFGVDAADLTLEQGAVLAAILRSPGRYSPENNADRLEQRWGYVLDGMVEEGWLAPADRAAAQFPEIAPRRPATQVGGTDGYLLETVRRELLEQRGFTEDDINRRGLRVVSTFDPDAQAAAVAAVEEERPTRNAEGVRVGLASVDPATGAIVAMYGGPDYATQQYNDATQSAPQAGSTFKPFGLVAALEDGIALRSTWNGASPRTFDTESGGTYTVPNFGGRSYGQITLLRATEDSVNTVYVDVGITVGTSKVVEVARRAGVPDDVEIGDNPTVVLGTASPTALDMAGAYATFAAQGRRTAPTSVTRVSTSSGGVLYELQARPQTVFAPDVMADTTFALQRVVTDGSGFEARRLGRPAAGKTGTTNSNRSAWFVGYTPQLSTAVVLFRPDEQGILQPMNGVGGLSSVTGGSFPARIWTAYTGAALEGEPVQEFPEPANIGGPPPVSPSVAPTLTPSASPSVSPTPSESPSETPSPSPTPSESPSSSPSESPSGSPSASPTTAASPPAGG